MESTTTDLIDDLFFQEGSGLENQHVSAVGALANRQGFSAELTRTVKDQFSQKLDRIMSELYPQGGIERTPFYERPVNAGTERHQSREQPGQTTKLYQARFQFPPRSLVVPSAVLTNANDTPNTPDGDEPEFSLATRDSPKANMNQTQLLSHIIARQVTDDTKVNATIPDGALPGDALAAASSQGPRRKKVKHAPKLKKSIISGSNIDYKPSSLCHICGRKETTDFGICSNFTIQACKKVLYTKCVMIYEHVPCGPTGPVLDVEKYPRHMLRSRACSHCRNTCPERAKCNTNKAINKLQS